MTVGDYIKGELLEIIYSVVMIIYLFKLNTLNKELLSNNFDGAYDLLQYKDFVPIKFFGVAFGLFLVGCFLLYRGFHRVLKKRLSFEEIIISALAVIIIFILLIVLIVFIDNPILKAVLSFVLGGVAVIAVASK